MTYWIAYALLFFLARPFSKITLIGRENIPRSGPVIIAANHQRPWDIPLVAFAARRRVYFMAKAEFFENKLKAMFLKLVGAFPVHRGEPDFTAIKQAITILRQNGTIGIFPEGTLIASLKPVNLHGGTATIAAKSGAPVIPVRITYQCARRFFPRVEIVCQRPISGKNRKVIEHYLQRALKQ